MIELYEKVNLKMVAAESSSEEAGTLNIYSNNIEHFINHGVPLLMTGQIISQASAVEGILDDIIAYFYTKSLSSEDTQQRYLCFIQDILEEMPLMQKFKKILKIFNRIDGCKRIKSQTNEEKLTEQICYKWTGIRNRFAHGKLIYESDLSCILLHNGMEYKLDAQYDSFMKYQNLILNNIRLYPELISPFSGQIPMKK